MLKGNRNYQDGLWDTPITKTSVKDNNHYSILNQAQHQDNMSLHQDNTSSHQDSMHSEQNVANHAKTTSPRIMTQFLKQLRTVADENRFHNDLEQIKLLDYKVNVIMCKKQTHRELAQYLHASCLSPPVSTFVKDIKNNHFSTWPGLRPQLMFKDSPKNIATCQGHLRSEKQGL